MRFIYTVFSILFIANIGFLSAQDSLKTYNLDEDIVVTATRVPTHFNDVARTITVISDSAIAATPAESIPDVLETECGVDVRQRGVEGIQSDISIRGAGFEQTLILVNGIKLSDPQTGHHNGDIGVNLSDVDRMEVLKGPGSRLYGPNAFGGIINIITKKPANLSLGYKGIFGEHNLLNNEVALALPVASFGSHRFSASKSSSDGYRPNTDYNNITFSHGSYFNWDNGSLNITSGYNSKDFGANSFYTTSFPEQYEKTRTLYGAANGQLRLGTLSLNPQIYGRRHKDDFVLKRFDPSFYHNIHTTWVYGSALNATLSTSAGLTNFGVEWGNEKIESTNLGNHTRQHQGIFIQQQFGYSSFSIAVGLSAYYYSGLDWQSWPGADINFRLDENQNIYASYAQGFRVPTYTELYYKSSTSLGNANLKNEKSYNYEMGYRGDFDVIHVNTALFRRSSENLIDYVYNPSDSIYRAMNFAQVNTNGIETHLRLRLQNRVNISLGYNYLDSDLDTKGLITAYTLSNFRQQGTFSLNYSWLDNLTQTWTLRYEDRLNTNAVTLIDTRLSWKNPLLHIFLDISNLTAVKYEDIPGVPMPGRWAKIGAEIQISKQPK